MIKTNCFYDKLEHKTYDLFQFTFNPSVLWFTYTNSIENLFYYYANNLARNSFLRILIIIFFLQINTFDSIIIIIYIEDTKMTHFR